MWTFEYLFADTIWVPSNNYWDTPQLAAKAAAEWMVANAVNGEIVEVRLKKEG